MELKRFSCGPEHVGFVARTLNYAALGKVNSDVFESANGRHPPRSLMIVGGSGRRSKDGRTFDVVVECQEVDLENLKQHGLSHYEIYGSISFSDLISQIESAITPQ